MRFKPSIFPLLLALLSAADAAALGLGQITVHSRLGTRFQAEIELLGAATDGRPIAECFRLTQPTDSEAGIPVLTRGRVTVERQGGKPRLLISSEQFVNDPVLQLSVRAGCGAEVVRDYMLIIDPADAKAVKQAPPAPVATRKTPMQPAIERPRPADDSYPERWQTGAGESAQSIARNLFPRQPSAQRRFLKALQAANPELDLGSLGDAALATGTSLNIPDTRRYRPVNSQAQTEPGFEVKVATQASAEPAPPLPKRERRSLPPAPVGNGRMSDRLSISGSVSEDEARPDGLPLRLATELSLRTLGKTTENQRSIFRLEYKLLGAIYDQAHLQLDVAEQVRQLESSVAELQTATGNSINPAVQAETREASTPAPALSTPPVAKEITTPQPVHRVTAEPADSTSWWFGLAVLLGMVALLVWILRRHARITTPAPLNLTPETPLPEDTLPWAISDETPHRTDARNEQPSHETLILDNREPPPPSQPVRTPVPESTHGATVLTEQYEFNPVMELADIMLSFGRVKGATDALLEYIEANPDQALQPWMKLLDIYRQGGMRQDYETLAQKLNLHFNVAPADWDAVPDLALQEAGLGDEEIVPLEALFARLPNIGQIPRIKDEIARTWGTAEGFSYLNKLLRDNRKGERKGFALATVSELLFLLDIHEKRLKKPNPGEQNA